MLINSSFIKRVQYIASFALFLILFPAILLGHDIHGKVVDKKNTPIIGAYIIHLKTENHAHSNELGFFSLNGVQEGDTLLITHIGFETLKFVLSDHDHDVEIMLTEQSFRLDEIVVGQNIKSLNLISDIDMRTNPVKSSQEILQKVPGLIIGQHAGGGKAEQIFLRGFDIDHGTDISITVDGMPVNMVSHAHGQGYADLHFLIPETIDQFDFGKGPYYTDQGNFATAGYVNFRTKERLENSSVHFESGSFNTFRTAGLFSLINTEKQSAYVASEYIRTNGPFESSQNFNRLNLMAKYTVQLPGQNKFSLLASHFSSNWDASGQIPVRAVESGLISRFGAIDDTEGGFTSRTNMILKYNKAFDANTFIKNSLYYSIYDFELYSNFTFFLEDPINGDQIRQKENRQIFGFESEWNHSLFINNTAALLQVGLGLRYDQIDGNELSFTKNRRTSLRRVQLGDVDEANVYGYANAEFDLGGLLINVGARLDHLEFNYVNALDSFYQSRTESKGIISPKFNMVYNLNNSLQLFAKAGIGFHSNDTRVVVAQSGNMILPAAYGFDVGAIWKPAKRFILNSALWYLFSEQEFVYVGDAGIVEPSGQSRRLGFDIGLRYQLADWLFFDSDINYAYARSIDEPEDAQYIPLAPDLTYTGGFRIQNNRISGGMRWRYLSDRPASEDNRIIAKGYFVTDLNFNYKMDKVTLGFVVENLFDTEWNETQFATESRLSFESTPVEEIHFTPGAPFFIKGTVQYAF